MATNALASPWQRYLGIRLRGLIVLVLVLGSALGWIVNRAKFQRDAVAAIEKAGGSAKYEWELKDGWPNRSGKPRWPKWLVDRIGPDYFGHVSQAMLGQGASEEQMIPAGRLCEAVRLVHFPTGTLTCSEPLMSL